MKELDKELFLVRHRIKEKLADKGIQEINKDIFPFDVAVRSPIKNGKQSKRRRNNQHPKSTPTIHEQKKENRKTLNTKYNSNFQ